MSEPVKWDRLKWGVKYVGQPMDTDLLIGSTWDEACRLGSIRYEGEPTRPILFDTRSQCRAWVKDRNARHWVQDENPYRVIRVREIVQEEQP